jgi:hypothetical protein
MSVLYCTICDRDLGTPGLILARWHNIDVCLDCLADHAVDTDAEEESLCHAASPPSGSIEPSISDERIAS